MSTARTIAILGASAQRSRFSNKAVRAYLAAGWTVYPIHPRESEVEGLLVAKTIADLDVKQFDRVAFYLSPPLGLPALDQLVGVQVGEVWLNPGTVSEEVLAKAASMGLNVVQSCAILDLGVTPSQFPDA